VKSGHSYVILSLTALLFAPSLAFSQTTGFYKGTSADGSTVEFQVAADSSTGKLAVTNATVFFSAPCKGVVTTISTGWGYGLLADIVNRKVINSTNGPFFDISFNLLFSADGQSAAGNIASISPDLYTVPGASKASRALFCTSPKQTMSLTYSATQAVQHVSYGNVMLLGTGVKHN